MSQPSPDVMTLVRRGHTYSRRGEYAAAIVSFAGAIDLDPTDPELYFHRGNAYVASGEPAEAVEDFSRAIDLRPDYAAAFHNRATARADSGDLEASEINSSVKKRRHVRVTRASLLDFYKKRFGHSLTRALANPFEP